MPITLIAFIKKYKERFALVGIGLAFLIFIGGGMYLQKSNNQDNEILPKVSPVSVQMKTEQKDSGQKATESTAATTSYFLKPSPEELLEQLASMENLNADVIDEKINQMPVLWPAYFFALQETEDGRKIILLDVSEDGFGVVIESEADLDTYPQLQKFAVGEKVWIGGKILAVDPSGTGRIYLKTEQFKTDAEAYFLKTPQNTEQ